MRVSVVLLIFGSSLGACQAFTGTGDLEVTQAGAGAPATGGAGGEGGSSSSAGGGAQGAGASTSTASGMMTGSQTSSGSGAVCITCKEFFSGMGVDASTPLCADSQTAYDTLKMCLCTDNTFSCSGMSDTCGTFCSGQPWNAVCSQCAQDLCDAAWTQCQRK